MLWITIIRLVANRFSLTSYPAVPIFSLAVEKKLGQLGTRLAFRSFSSSVAQFVLATGLLAKIIASGGLNPHPVCIRGGPGRGAEATRGIVRLRIPGAHEPQKRSRSVQLLQE